MLKIKFLIGESWSGKTELFNDVDEGLIIDFSNFDDFNKEELREVISLFRQLLILQKDEEGDFAKHILVDEISFIYNDEELRDLFKELLELFKKSKKIYYITFSCFNCWECDKLMKEFDLK